MPPHDERYRYSQEWFDIVNSAWSNSKPFNHNGKYWQLKDVLTEPLPNRKPTIVNAGGSGEGKAFAIRNADLLFTVASDLKKSEPEVADLKAKAKVEGRNGGLLTPIMIICRPTEEEAKDFFKYYGENHLDSAAAEFIVEGLIADANTFPRDVLEGLRKKFGSIYGSHTIIGTPRQVAGELYNVEKAGFDGGAIAFVDYIKEFPYFRDEVLPLLEEAGLRRPVQRS
ncbi:hypothetical protein AC579_8809 [Pseudocercospora musae]|uniref:Luciferase-like domain-containing protein n=1 Tax=Pseudocercospora musae TaxID=113226 RepID=A0A139I568_9PEZI|nr:hypothetical protein AC579_8809 [Pseudocercospora musae]